MAKPKPQGGLVIRYDYLWIDEERGGREEGSKERPCAVVVAIEEPLRAVICAITHTRPADPANALEIPAKVKAHLGLDADRSWIVTDEVNIVDWDDPGIVPNSQGQWAYGFVPPALARRIAEDVTRKSKQRTLEIVDRPRIQKRREKRERSEREGG